MNAIKENRAAYLNHLFMSFILECGFIDGGIIRTRQNSSGATNEDDQEIAGSTV